MFAVGTKLTKLDLEQYFKAADHMSILRKILAQNLKALRKKHNLTQTEFAKLIGYSHPQVCAYENLNTGIDEDFLEAVSKAFNIEPHTLLSSPENGKKFEHSKKPIQVKMSLKEALKRITEELDIKIIPQKKKPKNGKKNGNSKS